MNKKTYNRSIRQILLKNKLPLGAVVFVDRLMQMLSLWRFRHPLSSTVKRGGSAPFFIIGCGRSGNTLLRSMLCSGGDISIPPESYVLPRVIRIFLSHSYLPWDKLSGLILSEFSSYKEFYTWGVNLDQLYQKVRCLQPSERNLSTIIEMIYMEYTCQTGQAGLRWGDKTPINTLHVSKILKVFPNAQFIHIERDPRDVACSYVNAKLYDSYRNAAYFWKACTQNAHRLSKKMPSNQYIKVSYESLVNNPEAEMARLCEYLSVPYSEEMLEYYKHTDKMGDISNHQHHSAVSNPISTKSIGRFKSELSVEEIHQIESVVGADALTPYGGVYDGTNK